MSRFPKFIHLCTVSFWLSGLAVRRVDSLSSMPAISFNNFFPSPAETQANEATMTAREKIAFRIRSTTEADVSQGISDMWAATIIDDQKDELGSPSQFNFRRKMHFLKSKDCVEKLLLSRLKAIRAGESAMEECSLQFDEETLTETERLRYLWSSDHFRTTMEKAASLANEPHPWTNYNFACAPETVENLQHKMLTAEDVTTGEILGFCEIAMLQDPSSENNDESETGRIRPTIVNLVVSSEHRRCGVAGRILKSAQSYVGMKWGSTKLSLYVDQDNAAAIALYKKFGFERVVDSGREGMNEPPQWYMSKTLRDRSSNFVW